MVVKTSSKILGVHYLQKADLRRYGGLSMLLLRRSNCAVKVWLRLLCTSTRHVIMAQSTEDDGWAEALDPSPQASNTFDMQWRTISSLPSVQQSHLYQSDQEMWVYVLNSQEAHDEATRMQGMVARVARVDSSAGRLRMWFIVGRRYNVRTGEWH